jgi:hypothetical protein
MNSQPCTDTLDLFDSAPPEPQQPPQATATAISDLYEQAKAYARKMAALQIRNGFEPTHLHRYTDALGQPLYWKTRAKHPTTGEKWIRAFHHDGAAFVAKEPTFTGGKPLYRLHELVNADAGQAVYICEGEQKADFLASLGLIATTSGGKSSANATDWQPIAARKVIVWPDFDDAGKSYQADVATVLSGLGCELWAVNVAQLDLPPKGDVIDWQQQRTASGLTTTAADVIALPVVKIEPLKTEPTPEIQALDSAATDDQPATLDTESELTRLASLSTVDYEQQRTIAAKALGMRASALDRIVKGIQADQDEQASGSDVFDYVKPWDEAVNGAALLDDIVAAVNRHIVCEPPTANATALWIAFTWCIDAMQIAPIACITAPEKRCGKTQLLSLIGELCYQPMPASNISTAALFRSIEKWQPTLLIDEADTFLKENEELRGVINAGHSRRQAYVIRTTGDNHEPTRFNVWGAKAISGIGHLSETIKDRSILLELRRKVQGEDRERLRHANPATFDSIRRKLARFSMDNMDALADARPALPDALNDRAQDNWESLLAIADLVGDHWPRTARHSALAISGIEEHAPSINEELLADIKAVFEKTRQNRITSIDLLEYLCADEETAWATWNKGRPITARQLSKRLDGFNVQRATFRIGTTTAKGYRLEDFKEAFKRYLPEKGVKIGNTVTSLINNDIISDSSVTAPQTVTDKNSDKPLINNICYRVTDKNTPTDEGITTGGHVTAIGNGNTTTPTTPTTPNPPIDSRHFGQSVQPTPSTPTAKKGEIEL